MRILSLLTLAIPSVGFAAEWNVNPHDGSFAEAMAAAQDGDVVVLDSGAYGKVTLADDRAIEVRGEGDAFIAGVVVDNADSMLVLSNVSVVEHGIEARSGSLSLRGVEVRDLGTPEIPEPAMVVGSGAMVTAEGLVVRGTHSERGAVEVRPDAVVALTQVTFSNNHSRTDGGAIRVDGGTVRILGGQFSDNVARGDGGAVAAFGGTVDLETLVFEDNGANRGGAIAAVGAAVVSATDFRMVGNDAGESGGHLFVDGAAASVTRATVKGGGATLGGAFSLHAGQLTVANAAVHGAGADTSGGAAYIGGGSFQLHHSVLYRNAAAIGGGVAQDGGDVVLSGVMAVSNLGEGIARASGTASVTQSLFWNNEGMVGETVGIPMDQSVIMAPPGFVDAEAGVFVLTGDSPGLDAGVAGGADLDGTPADMGFHGGSMAWALPDADEDGFVFGRDCDDRNPDIHEEMLDAWYDGIDSNCDGRNDFDQDGDGFLAAAFGGTDCDDTDGTIFPGAAETAGDGIDEDCDGLFSPDDDGDGWDSDLDCDDTRPDVSPDGEERWYDGVDQDCSGGSDFDQDGDGYDSAAHGGTDCDDTDAFRSPGTPEIADDGIDQDCDEADLTTPASETERISGEDSGAADDEIVDGAAANAGYTSPARQSVAVGCSTSGGPGGTGSLALLAGLFGLAIRRKR